MPCMGVEGLEVRKMILTCLEQATNIIHVPCEGDSVLV
jgi:hypothetical protein